MKKCLLPFRPIRPADRLLRLLKIPDQTGLATSWTLDNVVAKVIRIETAQRIVITAIALKRFQLKYGHLTEKLSALAPEFLSSVPIDSYSGKPLCYRLKADGSYLLYSVAENGTDDGGNPALPPTVTSTSFAWQNIKAYDLVWPQPATEAEIKFFYEHPPK